MVDEFWRRVGEGRLEMTVAVSNPRLSEVYPETLIRNLALSKQFFRRRIPAFDQRVYNAIDLMCGHSQMPQILAGAEHRYFMFSRPMAQQTAFWRKGLDGTRMLTARGFYGYKVIGRPDQGVLGLPPVPVWREPIGADDVLPDPKLARESAAWRPAEKKLTTLREYFEELERRGDQIKQLEGPLDSLECYIEAGLHGDRSLYLRTNQDEDLLLALERALALAGPQANCPSARLDQFWLDLLSCTGHAIQWAWAADYDERLGFAAQRRQSIARELDAAMGRILSGLRVRADLGVPLAVFNFQGWPVTGPVVFETAPIGTDAVLRRADGQIVPLQLLTRQKDSMRWGFRAVQAPACGYEIYYLTSSPATAANKPAAAKPAAAPDSSIENDLYRVTVQPDGALSITEKSSGKPLGDPSQGGLGDVVWRDAPQPQSWMMNGPLAAHRGWQAGQVKVSWERGPVTSAVRVYGAIGPHTVLRELRLWQGSPRLDYRIEIDAVDDCGVFCVRFPLGLDGAVTAGIPFGAEPRDNLDKEPFRPEFFVKGYPEGFYATRWADVSDARSGYTFICPWGAWSGYAYRRDERALEFQLLRVRPMPAGEWGQMHPSLKGTGHHAFECSLLPHAGSWREAGAPRAAVEKHAPLRTMLADWCDQSWLKPATPAEQAPQTDTPARRSAVEVTPANVVLSALRPVEDDSSAPAFEMRVYESAGRETDALIRLEQAPRRVAATNLLGRPVAEPADVKVVGREIRFRLAPWKIATLRIWPN